MSWRETVDTLNHVIPRQCEIIKKLAIKMGYVDFEIECPSKIEFSPEAEMSFGDGKLKPEKKNGVGKK